MALPMMMPEHGPVTMSSREIAELCEKRHPDVRRDIRAMMEGLGGGVNKFAHTYQDMQGKTQEEYHLPKDLTLTLVAGYNVVLRKRIIDRWLELEGQARAVVPDLSDPDVVLTLLGNYAQRTKEAEARVKELLPAEAALDRISRADGSLSITDAAKVLQMRPRDLFGWLQAHGWIYKRPGTAAWLGYQSKTTAGLLEHKVTTVLRADGSEKVTEQVRVTPGGLAKLAKLIEPPARLIE